MDNLKCKAKSISFGGWIEGYYQPLLNDKHRLNTIDFDKRKLDYIEVDPNTICKYTGLKDKYGKLIYEGDIIKSDWHNEGNFSNQKVSYINGCFMFGYYNAHEFLNCRRNVEIIGNIHNKNEGI